MKVFGNTLIAIALIIGIGYMPAIAQNNKINVKQTRNSVNRIEQRANTFKIQLSRSLDNSSMNKTNSEDYINEAVSGFENSARKVRENYINGDNITNDVRTILDKANVVESIMRDYRFDTQTKNTWKLLKTDLMQLANFYNVSWNPNNTNSPAAINRGLTGTYSLNLNQSDELNAVIDRALVNVSANQRERMRANLKQRLAVPDYLAIERRNNMITLASSNAEKTTFEANGKTMSERLLNGNKIDTSITFYGDRLVINSDGDNSNAFYISFEPADNGDKLRVTRRLNLEKRNQTITVVSTYNRTSNTAQWDGYQSNDPNGGTAGTVFYIPTGTKLTAVLSKNLSTKQTVQGDKFTMTISQPEAYSGAIIEGTVDKVARSGRFTGNAELNLNFETIRLTNGRAYRFEGLIDRITTQDGKNIKVDNEDSVQSSSQTKDTVVRSGIGAAIGAIIGGIVSGGKGVAVGAVIGASAGGGSVLIQGRDDIELNNGTTFELTASSPASVNQSSN
jgi:hypothetical protein